MSAAPVDEALDDGHLGLAELLGRIATGSVREEHRVADLDVVGEGDVLDLDLGRVPLAEEQDAVGVRLKDPVAQERGTESVRMLGCEVDLLLLAPASTLPRPPHRYRRELLHHAQHRACPAAAPAAPLLLPARPRRELDRVELARSPPRALDTQAPRRGAQAAGWGCSSARRRPCIRPEVARRGAGDGVCWCDGGLSRRGARRARTAGMARIGGRDVRGLDGREVSRSHCRRR